jgi:hypothetical protein
VTGVLDDDAALGDPDQPAVVGMQDGVNFEKEMN